MPLKPKPHIAKLKPYPKPPERRADYLRMDLGENTYGPPYNLREDFNYKLVLNPHFGHELSSYPDGYDDLSKRIEKYAKVNRGCILLTNGSDHAIDMVFRTFVDEGSEVIIPSPSFSMFHIYAALNNTKVNEVFYDNEKDVITFPTEAVLDSIGKETGLVILCNPNNPTGTKIKQQDIEKIIEEMDDRPVLIDEAYHEFLGETSRGLIKKYGNILVTRTFSKAFGMPSARIGYVVSHKKNIDNLKKVRGPFDVNKFAVLTANSALDNIESMQGYVEEVMERSKPYLIDELKKLGAYIFPSDAHFFLVRMENAKNIAEALKTKEVKCNGKTYKGILVKYFENLPVIGECLRITSPTEEQAKLFVSAMKDITSS